MLNSRLGATSSGLRRSLAIPREPGTNTSTLPPSPNRAGTGLSSASSKLNSSTLRFLRVRAPPEVPPPPGNPPKPDPRHDLELEDELELLELDDDDDDDLELLLELLDLLD